MPSILEQLWYRVGCLTQRSERMSSSRSLQQGTQAVNRRAFTKASSGLVTSLLLCLSTALPVALAQAQSGTPEQIGGAANGHAQMVQSVNINSAAPAELAAGLQGVGLARAEAIVRYREQFGPFESIDELSEVSGIGAATVERNRGAIVLN